MFSIDIFPYNDSKKVPFHKKKKRLPKRRSYLFILPLYVETLFPSYVNIPYKTESMIVTRLLDAKESR